MYSVARKRLLSVFEKNNMTARVFACANSVAVGRWMVKPSFVFNCCKHSRFISVRYKLPVLRVECPRTCPRYDNNKMLALYLFIVRLAAVARPSPLSDPMFTCLCINRWLYSTTYSRVSLSFNKLLVFMIFVL